MYDCDSDCQAEAKFEYPCPTISHPGRKCTGINPLKLSACEAARGADCLRRKLDEEKDRLRDSIIAVVAKDHNVVRASEGWTKGSCRTVGYGLITGTILLYSQPICTAIAPGVGNATCAAALAAIEPAIVEGVCTQLCQDKHLSDCH